MRRTLVPAVAALVLLGEMPATAGVPVADRVPPVSVGDVWVPEGDSGRTAVRVPVTPSIPAPAEVSVGCAAPLRGGTSHSPLARPPQSSFAPEPRTRSRSAIAPSPSSSGVRLVAAGRSDSLAVKVGAVIAWGDNGSGQTSLPAAAQAGVTAVAAGGSFSLVLREGVVIAWGSAPEVPAAARSEVTAIAAGDRHCLALKDGGVIAWGDNSRWQAAGLAQHCTAMPAGRHRYPT